MTFWEHIKELRQTLLFSFGALLIGIVCCLFFYQNIFAFVTHPLQQSRSAGPLQRLEVKRERLLNAGSTELLYTTAETAHPSAGVRRISEKEYAIPPGAFIDIDSPLQSDLLLFSPTEGMLTAFKTSFWLGLLISSPFWGAFLLRFILPGLYPQEKRLLFLFVGATLAALSAGVAFAYFVTIPLANQYFESFNATIGRNFWSLAHYLDYTLMLMIANGFAFEIGLILFLLVHGGVLTAEWMVAKRRHMIVLAFILGALLTPPDVPTQLMLAIPLIGLYELAILYAKLRNPHVN